MQFDEAGVERIFTYHAPTGTQATRYEMLRGIAKSLARSILVACPESRERSLALSKLQELVMWSNASIAINEEPVPLQMQSVADVAATKPEKP